MSRPKATWGGKHLFSLYLYVSVNPRQVKTEFLSLNTHFRRGISYSHHGCLYVGSSNPSSCLQQFKPACLVLILHLTPLKCIFSQTGQKITVSGSGWAWAAVLHVCFPAASEPGQQRQETRATLRNFDKPRCAAYTGSSHCIQLSATSTEKSPSTESEPLINLFLLTVKNIVFNHLGRNIS